MASIIAASAGSLDEVMGLMAGSWGEIDFASAIMDFDQTDYYNAEMGSPLIRRFVSFEQLLDPGLLPEVKHGANRVEEELKVEGRRSVNIDPGYITAERLVLATGKNYTHRIYLAGGIYADLTLIYTKGRFEVLPWTYPDYGSERVRTVFAQIRRKYLFQLNSKQ
ncbi:MAG: DUF4416 family protein [Pseudomonadota bacterium]